MTEIPLLHTRSRRALAKFCDTLDPGRRRIATTQPFPDFIASSFAVVGLTAGRHGLPGRTFEQQPAGVSPTGATGFIHQAVEAIGEAERALTALQDSMLPVEVGDAALRSGHAECGTGTRATRAGPRAVAHPGPRSVGAGARPAWPPPARRGRGPRGSACRRLRRRTRGRRIRPG
jgi:hypothetical protein